MNLPETPTDASEKDEQIKKIALVVT
jgi:hypothetical protein